MTKSKNLAVFGRSRSLATLCAAFLLVGCEWIGGVATALVEGSHYQVREGRVEWVYFVDRSTSAPPLRTVRSLRADAGTFRQLEDKGVARDASQVFCDGTVLTGADPDTIRIVQARRLKSRGRMSPLYLADDNGAWRYCDPIPGADGPSLEILSDPHARDADKVFYEGVPLEGADPDTFETVDDLPVIAIDRSNVWSGANRVPLNRADFRYLGEGDMSDGVRVFWLTNELIGADPATFHVPRGMSYGRDRSGCWNIDLRPCPN